MKPAPENPNLKKLLDQRLNAEQLTSALLWFTQDELFESASVREEFLNLLTDEAQGLSPESVYRYLNQCQLDDQIRITLLNEFGSRLGESSSFDVIVEAVEKRLQTP
ncbi:MAG: hypothetical protein K2X01_08210 [Cyanobacteria bacterium]|nr:hypothetical protein [Cyanobacteriota bacterium]